MPLKKMTHNANVYRELLLVETKTPRKIHVSNREILQIYSDNPSNC